MPKDLKTLPKNDRFGRKYAIDSIYTEIITSANEAKKNAEYNGEAGDGGASDLLDKLQIWMDGLNNKIPDEFASFAKEVRNKQDPKWPEYCKLKKHFGDA